MRFWTIICLLGCSNAFLASPRHPKIPFSRGGGKGGRGGGGGRIQQMRPRHTSSLLAVTADDPTTSNAAANAAAPPSATRKNILFFIFTTTSIWLSESILSLIDVATVGLSAPSIHELAALGPATMLIDSLQYLSGFLYISTTNLLASEKARCATDENNVFVCEPTTSKVVTDAIGVALGCGCLIFLVVNIWGASILRFMFDGNNKEFARILTPAMKYVRIRSCVSPIACVGMVSQAALLASGNKFTPVLAVAIAAGLNLCLDLILVCGLKMGVAGASTATAMASCGSAFVLVRQIRKTGGKKIASIPTTGRFLELITFAGPIFGVMCAKLISFSLLSLKAAKFGLVSLASHNILLKILFFFTTFGDSLSQVGQTYLPGVLAKSRSENDAKANKEEMNLFSFMKTSAALAIAFGGFCGLSGFTATKMGWLFTPNVDVVSKMATISRPMLLSLFLHPVCMTLEGLLISQRSLKYLMATYVVSFLTIVTALTRANNLTGVWMALFSFQVIRVIQFSAKNVGLARKAISAREGK